MPCAGYLELLISAGDPRTHVLGSLLQRRFHHRLRIIFRVNPEKRVDLGQQKTVKAIARLVAVPCRHL